MLKGLVVDDWAFHLCSLKCCELSSDTGVSNSDLEGAREEIAD